MRDGLAHLKWLPQWQQITFVTLLFLALMLLAYRLCFYSRQKKVVIDNINPHEDFPTHPNQEYNYFATKESIHAKIHLAKAFFVMGKHNEAKQVCLEILSIATPEQRTQIKALMQEHQMA